MSCPCAASQDDASILRTASSSLVNRCQRASVSLKLSAVAINTS